MADVILHGYQEEVVQRALQGENIIVWLPTGAGKTRAAVYVARKHLERTPGAKVVVLVHTVHLVEQHYSKEFHPFLGHAYKVTAVSSDSHEKDFLGAVLRDRDLLVCTAQILLNALDSDEEDKHVELSDITRLVVDECHRTVKKKVYNKIMRLYLEKKMSGDGRLPQVLGLTASLGSGGAKSPEKAVQHVLQMCANLDCAIACAQNCIDELNEKIARPLQTFDIVDKRQERWGYKLKYHKLALLPNLAIKHFALETPGGRTTVKKWKDVPFAVEHFTFSEYCRRHAAHLLD